MSQYYNTSKPSLDSKNTINSVSIDIRDFLLTKNLRPQYPQLSTTLNGAPKIGEPVTDTTIGANTVLVPIGLPLEVEGIKFKENNSSTNQFKNDPENANALVSINLSTKDVNPKYPESNWPQGTQKYPNSATEEVTKYGLIGKTDEGGFRKQNVIKNLYLDTTKQIDISSLIGLNPTDMTQQVSGYLDTYGGINLGGKDIGTPTINIIGSVLNGQGVGIAKGGVVPNFDIKSSLAGRVLGATGLIKDTRLGTIGGQQLALALANNAGFNVQQDILGTLNVQDNILSLVKDGTLAGFRSDYTITKPSSTGGQIADYTARILGFTLPKSYLDDAGSIFQSESGNVENITRANAMIMNTGKGQNQALLTNVNANLIGISPNGIDNPSNSTFRVGYAPAYTNNKGELQISDFELYAFSHNGHVIDLFSSDDKIIPNLNYNRTKKLSQSGFKSPEELVFIGHKSNPGYSDRKISDVAFSWGTDEGGLVNSSSDYSPLVGDKKSLLVKTQELFKSKGMMNIVTAKGDMQKVSNQIQQANGGGFSKGSQVLQGSVYDENGRYNAADRTAEDTYCRSWTTLDRYDSVNNLIRKHGLWGSPNVPYRFNTENSVLDEFGVPKIAPYTSDKPEDPKKFMFSLENLAWSDYIPNLPQREIGDGDLISGKRGRIMWFPPYNIQFSENNAVNWEANNFIGRGESLYTYNNTERSGTLSFQIIVDHPSYVNAFRGDNGPDDNYVASFWAGCIDPNSEMAKKLTPSQISSLVTESLTKQEAKVITPEKEPDSMTVYFPNDNAILPSGYENGLSGSSQTLDRIDYYVNTYGTGFGLGLYPGKFTSGSTKSWPDRYNYGLNFKGRPEVLTPTKVGDNTFYGYFDPGYDQAIIDYLNTKCKYCVVTVSGYASPQGKLEYNQKLSKARAKYILDEIKLKWVPYLKDQRNLEKRFKLGETVALKKTGCKTTLPANTNPKDCKIDNNGVLQCLATDTLECKQDRRAVISFKYDSNLAAQDVAMQEPVFKKSTKLVNSIITDKFYDETKYFDQLVNDNAFVFDRFRDKIKYFHPAFHSTTPEGLNSRLTFLLQCTRQGPTSEDQGASNLAFGRPPVCILRIGDFYNTKIIIDNIGIDYEPLVWDLNPEGIGVQPMIANVNMTFKFIGGSTLMGPLNKLQNALSFNYFANTRVYDPRADYISKEKPIVNIKIKNSDGSKSDASAFIPDSSTGYYITPGSKDIRNPETIVTEQDITDNTPEVDQLAAAELAVSGVANQNAEQSATPEIYKDEDVINCFGVDAIYKFDDTDDEIDMAFRMVFTTTRTISEVTLNKSQKGFVYVTDTTNKKVLIGIIIARPNSSTSIVLDSYMSNGTTELNSQVVSFAGSQNKTNIYLSVDIEEHDSEKVKFIQQAWNKSGSNFKLEWVTGTISNYNFSKTIGI